MNIPLITKWLKQREIKVYVADFILLEQRKAHIQTMRQYAEDVRRSLEQDR